MDPLPVTVIVLAAQRTGVVNPLAARAGVSHKCLVPICERPLIEHVLEALTTLPAIREIRVVLEPDGQAEVDRVIEPFRSRGTPITLVDSDPNIVESVLEATKGEDGPFIVTTADNVLLTHDGLEQVRTAMRQADAVIGVTTRERVWAIHRQGQRGFYDFKDAGYANCNLYGLANRRGMKAAEIFREGGQFQSNKGRMVRAFGLFNILMMRFGLVTLPQGLRRVGKRFDARLEPVIFEDGALAIDVDNERTYAICEWVLGQRLGMDIPKPEIDPASK
ncbi:NTP transferase domain-containing protein [Aurantiacibacter poecillastricola]|uniref:NTP transferase domain-containing protein n=1 Tax=Aurantiacibacter poecillastricola TaxID=3064385 RepID=UPI00273E2FEA|nr:NTP transferase domain-containing protein [Aurantiacibacter sp. 219JJ12-13]MDP5262147.1 NTP transferase domain-containing protein [Aurantiacibacter sp. 219JJ12-13]